MTSLQHWLQLSKTGQYKEANKFYFQKLLPEITASFSNAHEALLKHERILISILGYSPEPIILTALAMKPDKHFIVTTNKKNETEVRLTEFLNNSFELIRINDENFGSVYAALHSVFLSNDKGQAVIDITGGKKSTVAAAAIFARDHACKVVYVDFTEYLEELRKPMPGSEVLNIVYDPRRDQPEIKTP